MSKSPIFEKLMQGFLKVPKMASNHGISMQNESNSLEKACFNIVVASWCSQQHHWPTKLSRGVLC
jgi:hypothetical protein